MKVLLTLILLTSFLGKAALQILTQAQLSITRAPTKPVHFHCDIQQTNFAEAVIHWYRQRPGESLQRLLYFKNSSDTQKDVADERLIASKVPETQLCVLLVMNIREDDAGTYYCAYWEHIGEMRREAST